MRAPNINVDDVIQIITDFDIQEPTLVGRGGQKTVFSCKIKDCKYALKFMELAEQETTGDADTIEDEVLARAKREIDIMDKCNSSTLVKLGPIKLRTTQYNEKTLLYYSEEFIEGQDLFEILHRRSLSPQEVITLGINIATAIDNLWAIHMVHRDIKPKNIMQNENGNFVLLDTGIALDTTGNPLTQAFQVIGTRIYMSPEQLMNTKNIMDFRSDLFSLGIVMYEAYTNKHPFISPGLTTTQLISNILMTPVRKISDFAPINRKLEIIILRLLSKQPHMRFKSCSQFINKLTEIREEI